MNDILSYRILTLAENIERHSRHGYSKELDEVRADELFIAIHDDADRIIKGIRDDK